MAQNRALWEYLKDGGHACLTLGATSGGLRERGGRADDPDGDADVQRLSGTLSKLSASGREGTNLPEMWSGLCLLSSNSPGAMRGPDSGSGRASGDGSHAGLDGSVSGPEPAGIRSVAPAPSPRRHPSLVLGVAGLLGVLLVSGMGWRSVRPPALSAGGSSLTLPTFRGGSRRGRSDARFRSFAAPAGPVQPLQFGLDVVPFVERQEAPDAHGLPRRAVGELRVGVQAGAWRV